MIELSLNFDAFIDSLLTMGGHDYLSIWDFFEHICKIGHVVVSCIVV